MNKMDLFILLSNIQGVGSKTISRLLSIYKNDVSINLLISEVEILRLNRTVKEEIKTILKNNSALLLEHKKYMDENSISILDVNSSSHDYSLANIYNAPPYLYTMGNMKGLGNCIGVIGARNCSEYGRKIAYEIGKDLALSGYTVVSGMAYGIDSYAHNGALDAGGKTIAVLGSGVDVCYPKSNFNLYMQIKEKGLVISEYALKSHPTKFTFPQRNRLISGLCKAIIVVEARERSGTMITVNFALEQGRQIFAVPGNINSTLSNGTNELIKTGATPYTGVKDIELNVL